MRITPFERIASALLIAGVLAAVLALLGAPAWAVVGFAAVAYLTSISTYAAASAR
jgi:hypothetical protein